MSTDRLIKTPISAEWVLKRIQEEKRVRLNNASIEGDLDISKLDLPTEHVERTDWQKSVGLTGDSKVVKSSIVITNSHIQDNLDLSNSILREGADFIGSTFSGNANFIGSTFSGNAYFSESTLKDAYFSRSTFSGNANFSESTFSGNANFSESTFKDAYFSRSTFKDADFSESTFSGNANFSRSTFSGNAYFSESTFNGIADFRGSTFKDAYFSESTFSGNADFRGSTFSGNADFEQCRFNGERLDFRDTRFTRLQDQEFPCRRAKQLAQNLGDKEEADNYYYREMEGRRIRLQEEKVAEWEISFPIKRTIELNTNAKRALFNAYRYLRYNLFEAIFIERIFGYGVRPYQLAAWWLFAVLIFGLAYWGLKGIHLSGDQIIPDNTAVTTFREYLYFSIVTSATPGYGGYRPHGVSQWIAGAQAIFGTFMWAAFITTFARKYMR